MLQVWFAVHGTSFGMRTSSVNILKMENENEIHSTIDEHLLLQCRVQVKA